MDDSLNRMQDAVFEGNIRRIDFENDRGVIEMSTPSERETLVNSIHFPLSELRVPKHYEKLVDRYIKFTFKLRTDPIAGTHACEVTPVEQSLCCAQIYNIGVDFCRVLLNESKLLANLDLDTLKRVFPHHLGFHIQDCCIISLSWTEVLQAYKERRLPVAHLIEVHESMEKAAASLKFKAALKRGSPASAATKEESTEDRREVEKENADLRKPSQQSKAQLVVKSKSNSCRVKSERRRIIRQRSPSPTSTPVSSLPTREQIERAYWSGVRDGASHYQQIMAPYYSCLDPNRESWDAL